MDGLQYMILPWQTQIISSANNAAPSSIGTAIYVISIYAFSVKLNAYVHGN